MGIFNKSNRTSKQTYTATIIAPDSFLIGGIDTNGDVVIDGKFEGVIVSKESVTIGEKGEVFGEVKADSVIVSGLLDGVVDASSVHILSTGKIIGKLIYSSLTVEENGFFDGEVKVKNSSQKSRYAEIKHKFNFLSQEPSKS
ncbi:bactofilin family protein [Arcobacter sp. FWKO B]|uniref:bactofilin family protein n=1 Tax=Arcobacter sp. FWKO B TaxID=2593672 RepID=UPI0018A590E7|nr:polymer-forming cytoskeletal protein [Arcobacter sp. FWKO B]QOG12111.1 polymer-forming cytoskeletal protein [Arcobacter sp. FWKO B]